MSQSPGARKKAGKKGGKKAKARPVQEKTWAGGYADIWTPVGGTGPRAFGASYDIYGEQPEPAPLDLLRAFEDIVYACVGLISRKVAKAANKYKLVVTTGPHDRLPKSVTKQFDPLTRKRIEAGYPEYTRRAIDVQEVADHALLDLLDKPNPHQSFQKLVELTSVYLELVGSAFWYVARHDLGDRAVPVALHLLPSHLVSIDTDEATGELTGYTFLKGGDGEVRYRPGDIIHFRHPNPLDPHTSFGVSPLRAAWQRFTLLRQESSAWQSVLTNLAAPGSLIAPPDGETWTDTQAERVAKQVFERFRLGGQGGPFVVQDSMEYTPVSTPPKDLAALQMYDSVRASVCTAYGIAPGSLLLTDTTEAAADTSRRLTEINAVAPRVEYVLETISHHLCPDRLFLAADSVVSPDKVFEHQRSLALVGGNIITINEGRVREGYDPRPGGDKLLAEVSNVGTASAQTYQTSLNTRPRTKGYKSTPPDPKPLADALARIFGRQAEVFLGRYKEVGDLTAKALVPFGPDWTDAMRKELTPVLRAYYLEGADSVLSEIGGTPDIRRLAVQSLDRAVEKAVYEFADSTNATTSLSIDQAVEQVREAMRNGLSQGEGHLRLTDRIKDIFSDLSTRRAYLVAETESTRAKHAGELLSIQASGVECKKQWLADNLACDICRNLDGRAVPLDTAFATVGSGTYSVIDHPPGHPGCRCSLQYQFGA